MKLSFILLPSAFVLFGVTPFPYIRLRLMEFDAVTS